MDSIEDLFEKIAEQSTSVALVTFREDVIGEDEEGASFHYAGNPFEVIGMLDAMRVKVMKELTKQYRNP